jgi:hypothetical protein
MHIWLQFHQPNPLDSAELPALLLPVAGAPLLAHMLGQMDELLVQGSGVGLTITAVSHPTLIAAWLSTNLPALNAHVTTSLELPAVDPQAPLWVFTGQAVVIADYLKATQTSSAPIIQFVPPVGREVGQGNTAVTFFRHAEQYHQSAQSETHTHPAVHWYTITSHAERLEANIRLLAIGYGSDSAVIERSYVEGFTVLPPVFIHDDAEIDAAIIGPYASIGAGTLIKNSVIRRSVIAENCHLEDIVLTDSLLSPNQQISGSAHQQVS